ncbi:MAG: hypothetical protein ACFFG0_12145 [Candidatus Thorarchaeota archaeon]
MSEDKLDITSEIIDAIVKDKKTEKQKIVEEIDMFYNELTKYMMEFINSADIKLFCSDCGNELGLRKNLPEERICEKCGFNNTEMVKKKDAEDWKILIDKTAKLLNTTREKALGVIKSHFKKLLSEIDKRNTKRENSSSR